MLLIKELRCYPPPYETAFGIVLTGQMELHLGDYWWLLGGLFTMVMSAVFSSGLPRSYEISAAVANRCAVPSQFCSVPWHIALQICRYGSLPVSLGARL